MTSVLSAKEEVKVMVLQTAVKWISLTSDTSCKFGGPKASFRLDNSLGQLLELRKVQYLLLQFYTESVQIRTNQKKKKKE